MFGHRIKDEHHIVRYCNQRYYDCSKKEITDPDAFALRKGESYLSCFWKEFYKKSSLKKIYKEATDHKLKINKKGCFAILSVATTKKIAKEAGLDNIDIRQIDFWRSHSGIYEMTNDFRFRRNMAIISEKYNIENIIE